MGYVPRVGLSENLLSRAAVRIMRRLRFTKSEDNADVDEECHSVHVVFVHRFPEHGFSASRGRPESRGDSPDRRFKSSRLQDSAFDFWHFSRTDWQLHL